jgi:hypothetical protein
VLIRGTAPTKTRTPTMKDILLLGMSLAFFGVSWLYANSFDRL